MIDNDRITDLETRIATLESTTCRCLECQASKRQRITERAILEQLAIERAPDAIAQVRRMSPRDQVLFFQRAAQERAIELLISHDVTDEERALWAPIRLRDRIELELIQLPDRVRVRQIAKDLRYTPSHIFVNESEAKKLMAAGLGDRVIRKHSDAIEFVPLQISRDFPSPVVERHQLDAMLLLDTRLRDCIAAEEIVIERLSEIESRAIEAQLWRDVDWSSRPKRSRKKVARLKVEANRDDRTQGTSSP